MPCNCPNGCLCLPVGADQVSPSVVHEDFHRVCLGPSARPILCPLLDFTSVKCSPVASPGFAPASALGEGAPGSDAARGRPEKHGALGHRCPHAKFGGLRGLDSWFLQRLSGKPLLNRQTTNQREADLFLVWSQCKLGRLGAGHFL